MEWVKAIFNCSDTSRDRPNCLHGNYVIQIKCNIYLIFPEVRLGNIGVHERKQLVHTFGLNAKWIQFNSLITCNRKLWSMVKENIYNI